MMSIYRIDHHLSWPVLRGIFIAATATLLASMPLAAQRFSEIIGGTDPARVSGQAIIEAANGDLVSVGESYWDGSYQRTYIVRTDPSGVVQWQHEINFWGDGANFARDIKEYDNGDFVVVGGVDFANARKAYALRITSAGNVVWAVMFGGPYQFNGATGVVIAEHGSGAAQPGDIVVAGASLNGDIFNLKMDGLMIRLNASGNVVWFKSYHVPTSTANSMDVLHDLDETRITSAQGTIGDIVAIGNSGAVPGNSNDIWMLRVNGNTGDVGAAPYGSALFGSTKDDYGYSIRELRHGAHPGNLVVTGSSAGYGGTFTDKVYAMQLHPQPCDPLNPRAATYLRNHDGAGASIREISSSSVGTVGNVVVAGTIHPGPFGSNDVLLQEFQEGTMAAVDRYWHYGGTGMDYGESVTEVVRAPATQGYAIAGSTRSPELAPPGTGEALYIIRNNSSKHNVCQYHDVASLPVPASWGRVCTALSIASQTDKVVTLASAYPAPWYSYQPCYSPTKPAVPGISRGSSDEAGAANALALLSYPNPVRGSEALTLNYTLTADDVAEIRVIDLFGNTVYSGSSEQMKGRITEQLSTSGWAAGTYFVRVTANGHSATTRFVVTE